MKKAIYFLIGIIFIVVISACTKTTSTPTEAVQPTTAQSSQYPYPIGEQMSGTAYPSPEAVVVNSPKPTYTANPEMGNVVGKLLLKNNAVTNTRLYLAEVLVDENGKDRVAGLEINKAPTAVTGNGGTFAFINVKPGRYALILDIVIKQELMKYPDDANKAIIVQVEPGKEIDLGELNFDTLPLP